jgi:hypothetical protein
MVDIFFDFENSRNVQESMRELATMKREALRPDGTCFLFWIEPLGENSDLWEINGVKVSKQNLAKELRDFERWRKENNMPPVKCTFGMREEVTVQEAVNGIVWLYQHGIARVDLGQAGEAP